MRSFDLITGKERPHLLSNETDIITSSALMRQFTLEMRLSNPWQRLQSLCLRQQNRPVNVGKYGQCLAEDCLFWRPVLLDMNQITVQSSSHGCNGTHSVCTRCVLHMFGCPFVAA